MFSYYYSYYRYHITEELCHSLLCYAYKIKWLASSHRLFWRYQTCPVAMEMDTSIDRYSLWMANRIF